MAVETLPLPQSIDYVNVVFATDEDFLPITAVAITSVAANFSSRRRLRVFLLLDTPLNDEATRRFESIARQYNFIFRGLF